MRRAFVQFLVFASIVNTIAMVLLVIWLGQTGRLSVDRMSDVREVFALSIEDEAERQRDEDRRAAERAAREAKEGEAVDEAPVPSADRVALIDRVVEATESSRRVLAADRDVLLADLELQRVALEREREAFRTEVAAWEDAVEADRQRRADAQFAKTVKILEGLPGRQAKETLIELVQGGDTERAVAYLDAMPSRAAQRILREFKTDEEQRLATFLLESLRSYGHGALDRWEPAHADAGLQSSAATAADPSGAGGHAAADDAR